MASLQANLAKYFIRKLRQGGLKYLQNIKLLRKEQDKVFSRIRPPKNVSFSTIQIEHLSAEWIKPLSNQIKYPNKVFL